MITRAMKRLLVSAAMAMLASPAMAGFDELNLTQGVTPISREVYDLHMWILWVCIIIGIMFIIIFCFVSMLILPIMASIILVIIG